MQGRTKQRQALKAGWGLAIVLLTLSGLAGATVLLDEVIGAKNGKVYHLYPQECGTAKRINPENIVRFVSAAEAEMAGRRLCKACEKIRTKRQAAKEEDKTANKAGKKVEPPPRKQKEPGRERPPATRPAETEAIAGSDIPQFAKVTGVLLGGTVELDIGEKVGLLGVTCPSEGQPLAKEATRFLDEKTEGRTVQISLETPAPYADHRDALGRLTAYLAPQPDGPDLGAELISQGYAWLDREARFERWPEYARREEEAWRAQRGIWKPLEGDAGKEEVVTGRFALHYHEPNCPHVAHLSGKVTLTVNEAKLRRLTPCPLYGFNRKDK